MSLTQPMFTSLLMLATLLGVGCGDTATGSSDGAGDSSSTSTGTGTETGYVDQVPCAPEDCLSDDDCCPTHAASTNYAQIDCTSDAIHYSLRWSCVAAVCVNDGCDDDDDCVAVGLNDTWECVEISDKGYCVQPCLIDDDCDEGTTCSGQTDTAVTYCAEPPI